MSVDISTLGYVKLKQHLIQLGIPKSEVDKCPGRPTLLHLHTKWSGTLASRDPATLAKAQQAAAAEDQSIKKGGEPESGELLEAEAAFMTQQSRAEKFQQMMEKEKARADRLEALWAKEKESARELAEMLARSEMSEELNVRTTMDMPLEAEPLIPTPAQSPLPTANTINTLRASSDLEVGGELLRVATINVHGWKDGGYEGIVLALEQHKVDVVVRITAASLVTLIDLLCCVKAFCELLEWKKLRPIAKRLGLHYTGTGNGVGVMSR